MRVVGFTGVVKAAPTPTKVDEPKVEADKKEVVEEKTTKKSTKK